MISTLATIILTWAPAGGLVYDGTLRAPHPLAPTLPLLTDEEYARMEKIIDNFISYEKNKLAGAAGRKAVEDLFRLGPEAIFPLIEGYNKAANWEDSCPAVVIGRKIAQILASTQDADLLDFARENIGAGVKARRHMNATKDLRVACLLRKSALQRQSMTAAVPGQGPVRSLTMEQLTTAVASQRGANLRNVLLELNRRKDAKAFDLLVIAAEKGDKPGKELAKTLILQRLGRMSQAALRSKFQDERLEVRVSAIAMAAARNLPVVPELIDLLNDQETRVWQAAHEGLVRLARGTDHGPTAGASPAERAQAASRWREWWSRRSASR
jgi:hypothetical protein